MIQAELYIAQNAHKRAVWGGFPQGQVIRCRHEKPHTSERGGLFRPLPCKLCSELCQFA